MIREEHVLLIGFMGAGKSTVGRLLAERLQAPFIDCDKLIESRVGSSVSEIFSHEGEEVFRRMESEVLGSLSGTEPAVVACGGGVVVRDANRSALRRLGRVIYLRVTPGESVARIGDASTRPLLAGASGQLAATTLLDARESLYRSVADLTIDTVGKTPEKVAEEAIDWLGGDV